MLWTVISVNFLSTRSSRICSLSKSIPTANTLSQVSKRFLYDFTRANRCLIRREKYTIGQAYAMFCAVPLRTSVFVLLHIRLRINAEVEKLMILTNISNAGPGSDHGSTSDGQPGQSADGGSLDGSDGTNSPSPSSGRTSPNTEAVPPPSAQPTLIE